MQRQPPAAHARSPQEYDFEILDGSESRPGPNSGQIREIGPEWAREVRQNIGNPYQMEDNKAAPSAPPQGGGASRRPLGVLVVFHLVRISYVFGVFPVPFWTSTGPPAPYGNYGPGRPWSAPHRYSGTYSTIQGIQGRPRTSRDVPGTSREVPGTSREVPGTSRGRPGDVPGTSWDVPGTSRDVPGCHLEAH